ncbi:hypothetical protein LEMLEM_LOCUS22510 [Lemmus lemmus]
MARDPVCLLHLLPPGKEKSTEGNTIQKNSYEDSLDTVHGLLAL